MEEDWRDFRLTRLFPHWSREYLADQPRVWLERQLLMDEIAAEVGEYNAEKARRKASR